jgi:S1-C subfamily serine protease
MHPDFPNGKNEFPDVSKMIPDLPFPGRTRPGLPPGFSGVPSSEKNQETEAGNADNSEEPPQPSSGSGSDGSSGESTSSPAEVDDEGALVPSEAELPMAELFARVKPAVVRINVSTVAGTGHGSGFILNKNGVIVTNYHVVAGGTRAWVEFHDQERVEIDGVLFLNHEKDIAVLKLDPGKCKQSLVAVPLAEELPVQGTNVVAIGAPLGLDMSITEGIVSAIRTAKELEETINLKGHAGNWIQTTAAISPGNSGGPLLNRKGEVLAINTLTYSAPHAQALNFGMACTEIRLSLNELKETPVALSPIVAPPREIDGTLDESLQANVVDISDTPEGKKRLAEIRKVRIAFLANPGQDPQGVFRAVFRSELYSTLQSLDIEESLISNEMSVLFIAVRMESAGTKATVYVTSHILVVDQSTGGQQPMKLWERTGKVATVPIRSLVIGQEPRNLKKELRAYLGKLKDDVRNARSAASAGSEQSPEDSTKSD